MFREDGPLSLLKSWKRKDGEFGGTRNGPEKGMDDRKIRTLI